MPRTMLLRPLRCVELWNALRTLSRSDRLLDAETKGPQGDRATARRISADKAATDSSPSGGILFPRMSRTRPFGRAIDERTHKNAGGLRARAELAVDQYISRCTGGHEDLVRNAKSRKVMELDGAAKVLGPRSRRKPSALRS